MTTDPVVALTYFEGVPAPMVEIWTTLPKSSECAADVPQSHGYMRLNQPPCATDAEWYAMLRRSTRTVFLKAHPNEAAPVAPNARMDGVDAMNFGGEVRPTTEVLTAKMREYCEKHSLDPAVTSVMFNAAYEITDHVYAPNPGFPMPKVDPSEVPHES